MRSLGALACAPPLPKASSMPLDHMRLLNDNDFDQDLCEP